VTPPRKRNPENRGLPTRWALKHGAYYYLVREGLKDLWDGKRWFRLGKTLPEAYRVWAERRQDDGAALRTVANLLDRYLLEVAHTSGRTSANRDLEVIRHAFSIAVTWGALDRNPIKGQVSRLPVPPRNRLVEDGEITEALKVASDSASLVEDSERLGHADTGITQRVYRRKPVRVSPLIRPKGKS